jgi:predicted transcriptional regulator
VSPVSTRRSPDTIALELLDCVAEKGEASKWDLIKVLGNDAQFKKWIDWFFLPEGVLKERREGRNYFYTITERGELFHKLLESGNLIKLFNRVSGGRLR